MTDGPRDTTRDGVYDPLNEVPPAGDVPDLREEARGEMRDLAGHWNERLEAFDAKDAGAAADQRSLLQDAIRRFSRNRVAMLGLVVLVTYVLLAIFAPMLSDWDTA